MTNQEKREDLLANYGIATSSIDKLQTADSALSGGVEIGTDSHVQLLAQTDTIQRIDQSSDTVLGQLEEMTSKLKRLDMLAFMDAKMKNVMVGILLIIIAAIIMYKYLIHSK